MDFSGFPQKNPQKMKNEGASVAKFIFNSLSFQKNAIFTKYFLFIFSRWEYNSI